MSRKPIKKILVANRGEIAVRVLRTCREMGIPGVAVFSEPDRSALHVRMADEAYLIGPAQASESYLDAGRILDAATRAGADAIHPGYGFLSESPAFAEACAEAGITYIGPPPDAIRQMGDKTRALKLMADAGVPIAAGSTEAVVDANEAARSALEIGYPVLIKAAAGGGGKGMRVVQDEAHLRRAFETARSEAASAFGDGRVFIEKYIEEPRHIEFQILADGHGNVLHLFERECSIQRRHQKVIEEAPSSLLDEPLRARMGKAAVEAAAACGYVGAGTVEFLVDPDRKYYFLEMNTRLQVEHPVTEWITGLDLVAEQIRIANGEEIGYAQDAMHIRGHAIECRVYAEDPDNGFLPDAGELARHAAPSGPGVRVDAGVEEGGRIEVYYDPLISKVTAWGRTRAEAIRRMIRALDEYAIAGVRTTIPFCRFVMQSEAFASGAFTTRFVERHVRDGVPAQQDDVVAEAAALAAALQSMDRTRTAVDGASASTGRWVRRRRH
jgi:propionyl-CoA carboxylase alpha chain